MQRDAELEKKLKKLFDHDFEFREPYINESNADDEENDFEMTVGTYPASIFCGEHFGLHGLFDILSEIDKDDDIISETFGGRTPCHIIIKSSETVDLLKTAISNKLLQYQQKTALNPYYFYESNRKNREKTHPDMTPLKVANEFDFDPQLLKTVTQVDDLTASIYMWGKDIESATIVLNKILGKLELDNHKKYQEGRIMQSGNAIIMRYDGITDFFKAMSLPVELSTQGTMIRPK